MFEIFSNPALAAQYVAMFIACVLAGVVISNLFKNKETGSAVLVACLVAMVVLLFIGRIKEISFSGEGVEASLTEVQDTRATMDASVKGVEARIARLEKTLNELLTSLEQGQARNAPVSKAYGSALSKLQEIKSFKDNPIIIYYSGVAKERANTLLALLQKHNYVASTLAGQTDWSELGSERADYARKSVFIKYAQGSESANRDASALKALILKEQPELFSEVYLVPSRHSHGKELKLGLF